MHVYLLVGTVLVAIAIDTHSLKLLQQKGGLIRRILECVRPEEIEMDLGELDPGT